MKKTESKIIIKDHLAGFLYRLISETKTHYIAKDKMGETVSVHKTQATKLYWSENINKFVTIPE